MGLGRGWDLQQTGSAYKVLAGPEGKGQVSPGSSSLPVTGVGPHLFPQNTGQGSLIGGQGKGRTSS